MSTKIIIQNVCDAPLPSTTDIQVWVEAAMEKAKDYQVTLRVVDEAEIQALNKQFRKKDKPTNVLSFPNPAPVELSDGHLGDIVVCYQVIEQEAKAQQKRIDNHWAHMLIHSVLHLRGFDHQNEDDANVMEAKEIEILKQFDIDNPYHEVLNG